MGFLTPEIIFTGIAIGVPTAFWLKNQYRAIIGAVRRGGVSIPAARQKKDLPTIDTPAQAAQHWLAYVNEQPDKVPHLAVIGPSGAGKTTLVTAILDSRDGSIVVLTAKEGDLWGGIDYIGIDDDATYTTANRTFSALLALVKQRLVIVKHAVKAGKKAEFDTLTIVVDDFSTLQKECKDAAEMIKLVARLGRSLRIRLIMLADSALVKAIGLEGEGETRSNFAFVRVVRGHSATLEIDGEQLPIDTRGIDKIAERADLGRRQWFIPMPDVDEDVVPLLAGGISAVPIDRNHQTPTEPPLVPGRANALDLDTLIGVLIDAGLSANKIYDMLGGNRSDILNRVRKIRGET